MYKFKRSEKLKKILNKLFKKDRVRYGATLKKIDEVLHCENPRHYKNLAYDLKDYKGVHIGPHFVLVFKVNENDKSIEFDDLQHHDKIYKR